MEKGEISNTKTSFLRFIYRGRRIVKNYLTYILNYLTYILNY